MSELGGVRVGLVLGSSTGGIGQHVAALVRGLRARGASVAVYGPAAANDLFGFTAAGARFAAVEIGPAPRPAADARALRALRRHLLADAGGVHVLHAHGLRAGLLAGLLRPRPVPLVLTLHNMPPATHVRRERLLAHVERWSVRRADVVLAASADLAARAGALGAADVRFAPVAAPTLPSPTHSPSEVRAELAAGRRPLLLAVGRLHPQKGYDVLIEAATSWAAREPPPLVVIAGAGPEEATLRAHIHAADAPVRLLGRRADIADLLGAADVVVLPSRWEARALTAQEALRAGAPLVATAVGGLPDLLGDAAVLVPPGDPNALAGAVAGLLDHPATARALAERGRLQAASWPDEEAMLGQLAGLYRQLTPGQDP